MKIMSFLRVSMVGAAAFCGLSLVSPTAGHADDLFNIGATNLGINCNPSCGTVTVHDNTNNTYTFTVDLTSALQLHVTPGAPATVAWNGLAATGISSGSVTQFATTVPMDGFGNFAFGVDCAVAGAGGLCNPNGQSPANELIFVINAPSGAHVTNVALDIADAANGGSPTGFASVPGPILGAGLPGLLVACGGLLALARRRRQKIA